MVQTQDIPHILHDSVVVSGIMSQISSDERAYHLKDGLQLGLSCKMLFCKGFSELIQGLSNLEVLVMTDLSSIDWNIIYSLEKLQVLHISFQGQVVDFPELISCFPLRVISIQNALLELIPSSILEVKNLESLSIVNCEIKKLPAKYKNGKELKELFLMRNKIIRIPKSFMDLDRLVYVNLSDNRIRKLSIKDKWENVKYLNLNNNKIDEVICLPENVNTLLLSNNRINKFIHFDSVDLLVKLDLSNNEIYKIDFFTKSLNIRFLNLSKNKLGEIDFLENAAISSRVKYLKELNISDNQLEKIPSKIIDGCVNLEKLFLGKNNWKGSQLENLLMLKDGFLDRSLSFVLQGEIQYTLFKKYIISCNKYALSFEERRKYLYSYLNIDDLSESELLEVVSCPFLTFRKAFKNKLFGSAEDSENESQGVVLPRNMADNIRKLLLSKNRNNVNLALEMLKPYSISKELILLVFVVNIFEGVDKNLKEKVRSALPVVLKNINKSNFPKTEIKLYELFLLLRKEGWSTKDMRQYLFSNYVKGWLYGYKKENKNILLNLISDRGVLGLSGSGFSCIPEEIIGNEKIEILDLRKNNFTKIPEEVLLFPNLKIIYLQNNEIRDADILLEGRFNQVFLKGNKMSRNYLDKLNSKIITTLIY